jgi:hypothetical protein|tara:strand:- start:961 stop:1587 length:627 start_codon:yes stop_codon:yes gene_type:complete
MATQSNYIAPENEQDILNYQGSIPGQSLTNNRGQKYPWDQPPRFVNRREAEMFILGELTKKEIFIALIDSITDGVPIDMLVKVYLLSGFSRGLWDVDLMTLLIESVGFMMMGLAEKVGVSYKLYAEEEEESVDDSEQQLLNLSTSSELIRKGLNKIKTKNLLKNPKTGQEEIAETIKEIPEETIKEVQSLLSKPNKQEATETDSLLAR